MELPRTYNAAVDLVERNLAAGRGAKAAYIDDAGTTTYAQLAERVDRAASAITIALSPASTRSMTMMAARADQNSGVRKMSMRTESGRPAPD